MGNEKPQPTGSDLLDQVNEGVWQQGEDARNAVPLTSMGDAATRYAESLNDPAVKADAAGKRPNEVTLTDDEDDFLPYLQDVEENWDLREQAFQDQSNGKQRVEGEVSNEYILPGRKTVHGLDLATGERILNRDTGIPAAEEAYAKGREQLRKATFNVSEGYGVDGIVGLSSVAEGVVQEDKGYPEFERKINMLGVPPEQAKLAWQTANRQVMQSQVADAIDHAIETNEDEGEAADPPDIDMEQLPSVEGWADNTKIVYEAEEGRAFDGTDEELVDWYVDQMSSFNWKIGIPGVNSQGMAYYMARAWEEDEGYAQALLAMVHTYDRVNTNMDIVGRNIGQVFTDPVNLIGVPGGAALGTKVGGMVAKKAMTQWLAARIAAKGGGIGFAEGAVHGAGADAMEQQIRQEAGYQGDIEYGRLGLRGLAGAAVGIPVGAALGVAIPFTAKATAKSFRTMRRNARAGSLKGPLRQQIGAINPEGVIPFKNKGNADRLSTRKPWGKNPTEDFFGDEPLSVSIADMAEHSIAALEKNVARLEKSDSFIPHPDPKATPLERAEHLKGQIVDNLLWLHDRMDPAVREIAKRWYDGARKVTEEWAVKYGMEERQIAAVIASLSPEKDWYQNVSGAERMLDIFTQQQGFKPTAEFTSKGTALYQRGNRADLVGPKADVWDAWNNIKDKTLDEIDDAFEAGMWVRAYDETYNPKGYRMWSPDGKILDFARNKDGSETSFAWGYPNTLGKAVMAMRDASPENISEAIGGGHKVRNFYNNIISPNSLGGEVTIDTHAGAAGHFEPHGGSSVETAHILGAGSSHSNSGLKGAYPIFADAYREAAKQRGVLPREMQSITWEEIRTIFPDTWKTAKNRADVKALWGEYTNGKMSADDVREKIYNLATGGKHDKPDWTRPDTKVYGKIGDSTYQKELDSTPVRPGQSSKGDPSGTARGDAKRPSVVSIVETLKEKGEAELVKKAEIVVQHKILSRIDGDSAVLGHPGSSAQETKLNEIEKLMQPYRDSIEAEDLTDAEFIDRVMDDLAKSLGSRAKADQLIELSVALQETL